MCEWLFVTQLCSQMDSIGKQAQSHKKSCPLL
uniref:Uncharacterized protein n=1 Tax=Anguilla anguilla TaxID=7936 RepID=A0A0E9V6R6_ANGAN